MQAFKNIGLIRAVGMGLSYFNAVVRYKIFGKKIKCFEDYIIANFGRKLGEFNMLNYTEKIWGIHCKEIHQDWAKQRIKGLNLRSALIKAFFEKKNHDDPRSMVDQFYYPQYGTGLIYETIANKISAGESQINTQAYPTKVNCSEDRIESIELNIDDEKTMVHPSFVVSSIPITEFIKILSPAPPARVIKAAESLRWRSQVYLLITLDKERIGNDNWIYFPDKEIIFGRISEMKNFSKEMSPHDKTSLLVEFFVTEGDSIWRMKDHEIFDVAVEQLQSLHFFSKEEVRKFYVFRKKHVYPVYDLNYPGHLKVVKNYLDKIENLYYIGRPGRFQYNNQDHSLESGILAAKSIMDNKKYNLDSVGSDNTYFENDD